LTNLYILLSFSVKNAEMGMKKIWTSPKAYIDGADAETLHVDEKVTLINWGNFVVKSIHRYRVHVQSRDTFV
jgi:hypothetical protein